MTKLLINFACLSFITWLGFSFPVLGIGMVLFVLAFIGTFGRSA
jgi:hypothetical protein